MTSRQVPPPAGTTWTGDWDTTFHDRVFGADPVTVGPIGVLLTGVQHRSGATVSGVALRVEGGVIVDLTPEQARQLAAALTALAGRAETLDGISGTPD